MNSSTPVNRARPARPLQAGHRPLHKTPPALQRMAGFTYIEIIVATALIVVSLVPALDALSIGVKGGGIHETTTEDHYYLTARMEELLATPYNDLDAEALLVNNPTTPTAFSDSVTTAKGRTLQRQVYLSRYDADNADADDDFFTGTDAGLLWVRVEFEGMGRSL